MLKRKRKNLPLPIGTIVPNHIAIIPDGNRRWARARGKYTLYGHKAGFDRAIELARAARDWGVHTISLWGFSTENWDRTPDEISYLMKLYSRMIDKYLEDAHKEQVKIVHLGRKERLPNFLIKKIIQAEEQTCDYKKFIGNICIDYGGHDDIIRATQKIVQDKIPASKINKKLFEKYLDTHDQPYPYVDLLIRTSGEQRTSGLLMWQMEYAEMYWEQGHFPDFTPAKLSEAILDYSRRRRRFGGNDEVNHLQFKPQVTARFELAWWRLGNIPQGTKFGEYAMQHLREQWGLSTKLAGQASFWMMKAMLQGEKKNWKLAGSSLSKFYKLIKDEVKLAFEPSIVASIDVKLMQKTQQGRTSVTEIEDLSRNYLAEVYRISELQASKPAHLRALATVERNKGNWDQAKFYLELYYKALKDRVA